MIGSRITAPAARPTSLYPILAANSKDNASESTGWKDPSNKVTFKLSTAYPAKGPAFIASLKPFSTAGIYSFGTLPPFTSLTNCNPIGALPSTKSAGSKRNTISPNLPRPPDCFL